MARYVGFACLLCVLVACPREFVAGHPPCESDPDCQPKVMGDEFVGYRCRLGRCVLRNCGDARRDEATEECDDGNEDDWDGCDHLCQIRAVRPAPDAGPDDSGIMSDVGLGDASMDAGPFDAGFLGDAGMIVQPTERCEEVPAAIGALRVGIAPGHDYQPLPDINLTPAAVGHGMGHRLAAGTEEHGCVGQLQVRFDLAPQCALVTFFEATEDQLSLKTATLTVSEACPGWPSGLAGTWRLRQAQSLAWISVDENVPGMGGGTTCFGPQALTLGGTAHLYALGKPDLIANLDGVRVSGFFSSMGQGGSPPLACVPNCGNGELEEPETCDDGNQIDADGCSSGCRTECFAAVGVPALPPLDFGGDITIEGWVHSDGEGGVMAAHGLRFDAGETAVLGWDDDLLNVPVGQVPDGWNHWAVTYRRDLNRRRMFLNGTPVGEDFPSTTFFPDTEAMPSVAATVGALRISSSERYAGAFVPSYPFESDDQVQLNYDFREGAGPAVDHSQAKRHSAAVTSQASCPTQPTCGNGEVERGEVCDDGNLVGGDQCNEFCRVEGCGDGRLADGEACDDGNGFDTDACRNDCTRAACGDGVLRGDLIEGQPDFEFCDDGNDVSTDACTADCAVARCGDGVLRADLEEGAPDAEVCDDGNRVDTDACRNSCAVAVCGDGILRRDLAVEDDGYEECDDANLEPGDGCNANCQNEQCGNGRVDPGEACDDGNITHTDACRNDCVLAICGDGIVRSDIAEGDEGHEACDDGNDTDTDACRNSCVPARCGDQVVRNDLLPGENGWENCDDGNEDDDDECSNACVDLRTHQIVRIYGARERNFMCGLTRRGELRCKASDNTYGILGNGTNDNSETPVLVTDLNGVVDAAVGDAHACGLLENGSVRCWGANYAGQIGDNTESHRNAPVAVLDLVGATQITAGTETTCARLEDQTVKCWGGNNSGMLGIGNGDQGHIVRRATAVPGITRIREVFGYNDSVCAVGMTGFAWCWGNLPAGNLYANGAGPREAASPELLRNLIGIGDVQPGFDFICLRMADNSTRCWGANGSGQSGRPASQIPVTSPQEITGTLGGTSIATNRNNGCAIMGNNNLHCWGSGYSHQANPIPNLTDVATVSRFGTNGYCATKSDYTVHCWEQGQQPVEVTGW